MNTETTKLLTSLLRRCEAAEEEVRRWHGEFDGCYKQLVDAHLKLSTATSRAEKAESRLSQVLRDFHAEIHDGQSESAHDVIQRLVRERNAANVRAENAEVERERLRGLYHSCKSALKDCIEKLERYANRQGSKRMRGKSFSKGMQDNSANAGQHYPAVQSCMDVAKNVLKALRSNDSASIPKGEGQGELQTLLPPHQGRSSNIL